MKIIAQSDVITLASVYDGIGISSVVPQYYLSTSETETINGIWSYEQPVWSSGHYIWTRSEITNSDNEVTYTTPIVATALNSANKAASDASTKADSAYDTAESASETANTASTTAADAKKIASSANDISTQANTKAEKAESDATQAIQISNDAKDGVAAVNQDISSLKTTVEGMNTDISTAQQNITKNAEAITGINQNLSTNYATKTEVSDTKATLETDISTSASNLAASVKETYASKSEVSTIQGDLENKIQVNMDGLSATSKKVTSLESQTSTISQNLTNAAKTAEDAQKNAQAAIASAKTAQDTADTAVNTAKAAGDKATEAQNQLDVAKKKVADADAELKTAKANYDSALSAYNSVSADPNATAVQIETAKEKLTQAQTALSKALADVLTANHDVTDAQTVAQDALNNAVTAYQNAEMAMKDAKTAQDTADQAVASAKKANEDLAALTSTVNTQETKITQNSNSITSLANRTTTVENKFTGYYTKSEADSKIKQASDSITSTVSQTYETKTDSASKLSSAKSYTDTSSSQALKDAKADTDNKLKSYSTTTQMNSAIDQKADSITTTVSKTYETKTDSATKLSSANSYTDSKIKQTSDSITQQINSVNNGKNMVQQINLNSGGLKINVDKVEIGNAISNLVTGTVNEYAINTSSSTSPASGWSTTQPAWADGKYIWMRTKTTKNDGTVSYSNPACITGAKGATGATGAQGPKGDKGDQGLQGPKGATGASGTSVTVKLTSVTYQAGTSPTTAPTGTWGSSVPTVAAGQYLWTKTVVTYSDGKSTTAYSVARQGANGAKGDKGDTGATGPQGPKGATGAQGPKGDKGDKGDTGAKGASGTSVTVKSTSVTYAVTESNSQPADSAFTSTTMPSVGVGQYLWNKATTVFSDNKSITSYSVSRIGTDGKTGSTGASGKTTHFAYSTSADGKSNFNTSLFSGATYIGTYDDTTIADSTDPTRYKWTKLKGDTGATGPQGPKGATGAQGPKGDKGDKGDTGAKGASGTSVTVKSTSVTYAVTESNSQPADSAFTSTTMPSVGVGQYLWNKATTVFSDNKSITSYSVSRIGTDGKTGSTGASGKTTHFAYSTSADGKSNFNTSLFSGATYIGTYDDTTIADSTDPTRYKWTKLKGDTGATGPQGPKGATGAQGPKGDKGDKGDTGAKGASGTSVTVKSTSVTYAVTESNSQPADSAFTSTTMPSVGVGQYLWNKATTVFSDNKSITSYSVSRIGTDGKTGSTGASGKTTHFAYSTSADGKSNFNTSLFSGATYIGTYDDTTIADSTDPTRYKWTKLKGDTGATGPQGPKGATGAQGPKGDKGDKGDTGAKGPQGPKGATGSTGPQGENGVDLSNGKMLFLDPYFAFSNNSCLVYNNSNNGNVKIERVGISSDNPFSAINVTSYELKIINTGTANPGCGGFCWTHSSRANAIFIYRIIAKIPTGRHLLWASNSIGNNPSTKWLTPNNGTGKFTEYIFKLICGGTGTFSTTGFFYIDGNIGTTDNPIEWRVAYATCFDMTSRSDVTTALSTAAGKNKTVYSENADPSATTGYVSGDTWFNKATGGIWQFDGKAWKLHRVGTVSISNGAVTADKIAAGSITAEKLSASSVSLGNLDSSLITSNLLPDSVNNIDCWLPNPGVSGDGTMNDFLMNHTGVDACFYDCDDHKSSINFFGIDGDWEWIYYKISGLNRNESVYAYTRTYTLSFEFKAMAEDITLLSSKTYIPFGVFGYRVYDQQDIHSVSKDWNTGNLATIQVSPSKGEKRYSVTFSTYYNTIYLAFNFGYIADQNDCYFSFGKFKLEVGSEATPWETPRGLYLDKDEMHINADAITSGTVNAVDILGSHISGGTIVGNTIQGNTISGGTVSGTKITGGTISGTDITGSTIRTQYKNDLGWLGPTKWQKTTLGNDSGLRFDYRSSSSQPDINTSGTHYATLGYDGGKSVTVYAKDVNSSPYAGLVIHSGIIDEYLTNCVRIACTEWGTSCSFAGGHGTHFLVLVDSNFYTVWENSTNNIVVRHRINNAPSVSSSSGSVTTDNIQFSRQPNNSRWLYVTKTNGANSSITIIG